MFIFDGDIIVIVLNVDVTLLVGVSNVVRWHTTDVAVITFYDLDRDFEWNVWG
jgi:hypothetical protein